MGTPSPSERPARLAPSPHLHAPSEPGPPPDSRRHQQQPRAPPSPRPYARRAPFHASASPLPPEPSRLASLPLPEPEPRASTSTPPQYREQIAPPQPRSALQLTISPREAGFHHSFDDPTRKSIGPSLDLGQRSRLGHPAHHSTPALGRLASQPSANGSLSKLSINGGSSSQSPILDGLYSLPRTAPEDPPAPPLTSSLSSPPPYLPPSALSLAPPSFQPEQDLRLSPLSRLAQQKPLPPSPNPPHPSASAASPAVFGPMPGTSPAAGKMTTTPLPSAPIRAGETRSMSTDSSAIPLAPGACTTTTNAAAVPLVASQKKLQRLSVQSTASDDSFASAQYENSSHGIALGPGVGPMAFSSSVGNMHNLVSAQPGGGINFPHSRLAGPSVNPGTSALTAAMAHVSSAPSSGQSDSPSTRRSGWSNTNTSTSATSDEGNATFRATQHTTPQTEQQRLQEFAKQNGYNVNDPDLALYADLADAAAKATAQLEAQGDQDAPVTGDKGFEIRPHPEPEPEPELVLPPRTPSPDPVLQPALVPLVTHVPVMTYTILRYARSNTGLAEGADKATESIASAPNGVGALVRQAIALPQTLWGKGPQAEPKRIFSHGLHSIISATAPILLATLLHYLDVDDVMELRQTCRSIRTTLDSALGQELILHRYIGHLGYETWVTQLRALDAAAQAGPGGAAFLHRLTDCEGADPVPLNTADVMHFAIANRVSDEYGALSHLLDQRQIPDQRWSLLALSTTRAYNRVLARLRAQAHYAHENNGRGDTLSDSGTMAPLLAILRTGPQDRHPHLAPMLVRSVTQTSSIAPPSPATTTSVHNNLSPLYPGIPSTSERAIRAYEQMGMKRRLAEAKVRESSSTALLAPNVRGPWRPDRAPVWHVWVPASQPSGWLSDDELVVAEQQLSTCSVRGHQRADYLMMEGDVVWDVALGGAQNAGKFIYDGTFVRDLSYAFDPWGHLPAWLNVMHYPLAWYHNQIKPSTHLRPVVSLDLLPFRDELMATLELSQQVVRGDRYALHKWMAHARATVSPARPAPPAAGTMGTADHSSGGQVASPIHPSWSGQLLLELDGTAEALHDLIVRCAGPGVGDDQPRALLDVILNPRSSGGERALPALPSPSSLQAGAQQQQQQQQQKPPSFFHLLRERCQPGLIVLQPLAMGTSGQQ